MVCRCRASCCSAASRADLARATSNAAASTWLWGTCGCKSRLLEKKRQDFAGLCQRPIGPAFDPHFPRTFLRARHPGMYERRPRTSVLHVTRSEDGSLVCLGSRTARSGQTNRENAHQMDHQEDGGRGLQNHLSVDFMDSWLG
eukprot:scaffold114463_cov26-Tisochrysis_lutea.AAC.1